MDLALSADILQCPPVRVALGAQRHREGQMAGGQLQVSCAGCRQTQPEVRVVVGWVPLGYPAEALLGTRVLAAAELCPRQRFTR
jgi:hypothetical protein